MGQKWNSFLWHQYIMSTGGVSFFVNLNYSRFPLIISSVGCHQGVRVIRSYNGILNISILSYDINY